MTARAIIEAETPKSFLRQAPPPSIDRPMPFGSVPIGAWFRVGRFVFKRLDPERPGETGDWPDEEAQVMEAPNQTVVGEIWTFNHRSPVYPTTTDPKLASQSAKVSEAENPKDALRRAAEENVVDYLVTRGKGWLRQGDMAKKPVTLYNYGADKHGNYARRVYYVWKASDTNTWIFKQEGQKSHFGRWCGQHDLGYHEFDTAAKLLDWLKKAGVLNEAEDPKQFLQTKGRDIALQQLLRKLELDDVPWPDSFKEGQRVRRTRLNPFGARPHGGNPNDIGDLGTVTRFVGRQDEPHHSLYLVRWDRHPLGVDYMNHNYLEAADEQE